MLLASQDEYQMNSLCYVHHYLETITQVINTRKLAAGGGSLKKVYAKKM